MLRDQARLFGLLLAGILIFERETTDALVVCTGVARLFLVSRQVVAEHEDAESPKREACMREAYEFSKRSDAQCGGIDVLA